MPANFGGRITEFLLCLPWVSPQSENTWANQALLRTQLRRAGEYHIRSHLKKRILAQDVGGSGFQTAGILQYVEDLKSGSNTQIGPKDFFEMASRLPTKEMR
jgi:hypothetical protein